MVEKFSVGVYCRLSRDDADGLKNVSESESIANQKLLIMNFVKQHSDEFKVVEVYTDDGISGMTYERAAFNEMMRDIEEHRINAVIVKDLSRIGREQVETLNLIKKEFILKNVRFIAITDNYDSFNPDKCDGLSTSFKLLMNDYYCADISKKVRSSQKAKMERGDFIGSYAPYGYIKDKNNHNKLIIDKTAADVIRKIFRLYIGGMGKLAVARQLNAEGIPNPTEYKNKVQELNYVNSNKLESVSYWTYSTISKILSNEVYIGNMVQHKSQIKAYNIHKKVSVPKSEWRIVKNTHKAIISEEDFKITQQLLQTKVRQLELTKNISKYTGLLFCRECGRSMNKFLSKPKKDGSRFISFKCGSYSKFGKGICTIHSIREDELDTLILEEIHKNIKIALDKKSCEYIKRKSFDTVGNNKAQQLEQLKIKLESHKKKRVKMLRHLSDDIITSDDFKEFDIRNTKETDEIIIQIKNVEEKLSDENKQLEEYNKWLDNLLLYKNVANLDREVVVNLIDRIYISEDKDGINKTVEIIFKFKNPTKV